ncbi:histone-lysine N-methyltransferase SETMAR [Trichonephila clavipes]|nr:histone-lysine N-methyltransferase SETMAR [Trichonephila clavipes]
MIGKVEKLNKLDPHELNEKKNRRFEISSALLLQWLDADKASQHFPKRKLHEKKVMVTIGWSSVSLIYHSFLKSSKIITEDKYCNELEEMHQKLPHKHQVLINRKGLMFFHDNARPHVSMISRQKLHALGYETLRHSPYSTDLSPTDYNFFKHLDNFLQEECFKNPRDAETAFNEFVAS